MSRQCMPTVLPDFGMEREDAAPKELGISGYLYFVADAEFNRLLKSTT